MSDDKLFGGNQPTDKAPESKDGGDVLSQLVGPGKKFATVEDLAKGKLEADRYIEQRNEEAAALRAELLGKTELLKQVGALKASDEGKKSEGGNQTPIDAKALEETISRVLENKTVGEQRKANLATSVSKLREVLGTDEEVSKAIGAKAQALGYTPKALQEIAEQSPAAFLTLMGADKQVSKQPASTKGSHNAAAVSPPSSGAMNKAYCDEVKKTDPKRYWSPKFQNEMFKARAELGPERFYT